MRASRRGRCLALVCAVLLVASCSPPSSRSRHRWVIVVLMCAVTVGARLITANLRVRDRADAAEPSAWENRADMDAVVLATAERVGIDGRSRAVLETPLTCRRNDGRDGLSYQLHPVEDNDAPADIDALLAAADEFWTDLGYSTRRGTMGAVGFVAATAPDGAVIEVVSGPGGTEISGETICALTDGRPGSESTGE